MCVKQTGRIMKDVSEVKKEDSIEFGNIPGTPGCIFVEADLNLRPTLDYTASGMRRVRANHLTVLVDVIDDDTASHSASPWYA